MPNTLLTPIYNSRNYKGLLDTEKVSRWIQSTTVEIIRVS